MKLRLLSFGEILFDIIDKKDYLGGAPFNLAAHAAQLGMDAYMISSVGRDKRARKALSQAEKLKVRISYITRSSYPTGTVDVFLRNGDPYYIINTNSAWDDISLDDRHKAAIIRVKWDGFCFGTLAQRSEENRSLLKYLLENIRAREILYDINLRQNYYSRDIIEASLKHATILKLNEEEARVLGPLLFRRSMNESDLAAGLISRYGLKLICLTRGPDGASVYAGKRTIDCAFGARDVKDTVGAGDSFSAGFLYVYLRTKSPARALEFACRLGAFTAQNRGAIPEYSPEIRRELKKYLC